MAHPVERRAEVVNEFLAGVDGADVIGNLASLGDVRVAGLYPQEVAVGSEFLGALRSGEEASPVVVESFTGTRGVARPNDRRLGVVVS